MAATTPQRRQPLSPSTVSPDRSGNKPAEHWKCHKALISRLYLNDGLTLKDIRSFMLRHHKFDKSVGQYERTFKAWGLKKNRSTARWQTIARILKDANLDPSTADVVVDGEFLDGKKLKRELSRHVLPTMARKGPPATPEVSRNDHTSVLVRPKLGPGKGIVFADQIPWLEFLDSFTAGFYAQEVRVPCTPPNAGTVSTATALEPPSSRGVLSKRLIESLAGNASSKNTVTESAGRGSRLTENLLSLEVDIPERSRDSVRDAMRKMTHGDPSTTLLTSFAYLCFYLSNNKSDDRMRANFATVLQAPQMQPLFWALSTSDSLVAKSMMRTLLTHACEQCDLYLLEMLLQSLSVEKIQTWLFSVDPVDPCRRRPMEMLIRQPLWTSSSAPTQASIACLHALSRAGVDLGVCGCCKNPRDRTCRGECCQYTPLNMACARGLVTVIRTLLDSGARPCGCTNIVPIVASKDNSGLLGNIVRIVASEDDSGLLGDLLERGASASFVDYSRKPYHAISHAIWSKDRTAFDTLLKHGAEVNPRLSFDEWRVHEFFLDPSCSLFCRLQYDYGLCTPLTLALERDVGMASRLLESGARVDDCSCRQLKGLVPHDLENACPKTQRVQTESFDDAIWDLPELILEPAGERPRTALATAVTSGDPAMVELLLSLGADPDGCHGVLPLTVAARQGRADIVQLLLGSGADPDGRRHLGPSCADLDAEKGCSFVLLSPLAEASARGHVDVVRQLLAAGSDVNYCHRDFGLTASHASALCGAHSSLSVLLQQPEAHLDHPGSRRWPMSVLRATLQHEADVFYRRCEKYVEARDGVTRAEVLQDPWRRLSIHCHFGDSGVAEDATCIFHLPSHMIDECDVESEVQSSVRSFLLYMYKLGHVQILHHMADLGYSFDVDTAILLLDQATYKSERFDIVGIARLEFLLTSQRWEHYVAIYPALLTTILRIRLNSRRTFSIQEGCRVETYVRALLKNHPRACRTLEFDRSGVLVLAAQKGDFELVRLLIDGGANVNAVYNGQTLLQVACKSDNEGLVEELLSRGVDPNTYAQGSDTSGGASALGSACANGNLKLVRRLVSHGASVDAVQYGGKTALATAVHDNRIDVVRELIAHDADVDYMDAEITFARTPLQEACEAGNLGVVITLINHNADVNVAAARKNGVTALQAAASRGHFKIVQILLGSGAKVAAPASPQEGRTAIDGAAEHGRLDVVRFLLNKYDGDESIHAVCQRAAGFARKEGHLFVVELLDTYPDRRSGG